MEFDTFKVLVNDALLQIAQNDRYLLQRGGAERCLTGKLAAYLDTLLQKKGLTHLRADAELSFVYKPSAIVRQSSDFMPFMFWDEVGWTSMFARQPKLRLYRTAIPDTVIHDRTGGRVACLEGKLAGCQIEEREADFSKIVSGISSLGFEHGFYVEFPNTCDGTIAGTLFTKLGPSIGVDFINIEVGTLKTVQGTGAQRQNVLAFEDRHRVLAILLNYRKAEVTNKVLSSLTSPEAQCFVLEQRDALCEVIPELVATGVTHFGDFSIDVPAFLASMKLGTPSESELATTLRSRWSRLCSEDSNAFTNEVKAQVDNLKQETAFYVKNPPELRKLEMHTKLS
ncbi:MAG: hypothetical protein Q7S87_00870 [Agitococcus sp.]|nr:hypothetical protein [Agitococcus sp.]MDO9177153.1 hypothetical protein [Agitococcus sp.]